MTPSGLLLMPQVKRFGEQAEGRRQSQDQCCHLRVAPALDRRAWRPTITACQQRPCCSFEKGGVRDEQAIRISTGGDDLCRHQIAGYPAPDRFAVARPTDAPKIRCVMLGQLGGAAPLQIEHGLGFKIYDQRL
jgi:hypothetical protein